MCQKDCLAQAPTRRQPHPLLLKATPTKHATKPRPSNTSNVGVPCGCGLIFNDIHRFFSFSLLPTYPILSSGSPEKQLIELVWPYKAGFITSPHASIQRSDKLVSISSSKPVFAVLVSQYFELGKTEHFYIQLKTCVCCSCVSVI